MTWSITSIVSTGPTIKIKGVYESLTVDSPYSRGLPNGTYNVTFEAIVDLVNLIGDVHTAATRKSHRTKRGATVMKIVGAALETTDFRAVRLAPPTTTEAAVETDS